MGPEGIMREFSGPVYGDASSSYLSTVKNP
jgi:hypothetical protein